MGVRNRNLGFDARYRIAISAPITLATNAAQTSVIIFDPDRAAQLRSIYLVYAVAGDTASVANIQVGVFGALTRYANITPPNGGTTNAGTGVLQTLTNSTTLLAKATGLIVQRAAGVAANTGVVQVYCLYELIDRTG